MYLVIPKYSTADVLGILLQAFRLVHLSLSLFLSFFLRGFPQYVGGLVQCQCTSELRKMKFYDMSWNNLKTDVSNRNIKHMTKANGIIFIRGKRNQHVARLSWRKSCTFDEINFQLSSELNSYNRVLNIRLLN